MDAVSNSINGEAVTTRLASKMEETMQAFAIRSACFIGELEVPFSEEFDGHDFGATHIIAYVGAEPVGTMRVRWFQTFAMPERLAVVAKFRGHNIGRLLVERCCKFAESRGCNVLYSRALPRQVKYLERQGWRCLESEEMERAASRTVAVIRSVDLAKPGPKLNAIDARRLSEQFGPGFPVFAPGVAALPGGPPAYRQEGDDAYRQRAIEC
jgi:GNAT superfamily N-acetyltransferase